MDELDDVPMKIYDFVVVRIQMTPTTPEISSVDVYIDEMILILDETPSLQFTDCQATP